MPRCVRTLAAVALALAAGCASVDTTTPTDAPPATTAGTTAPEPATVLPEPGSFVPTSAGPVDPASLPPALQRVDALAGGDPTESACIRQGITASLGTDTDRPAVWAGVAGTSIVQCLPPAKLAATLADHLRDPALGLGLGAADLACARATLANSAADPSFTVLVGGVALADPVVIRQGAAGLDAACGTRLSPPAPA